MDNRERAAAVVPAPVMLVMVVAAVVLGAIAFAVGVPTSDFEEPNVAAIVIGVALVVLVPLVIVPGFFLVPPNRSKVIVLLGRYIGTVRRDGWHWTWPMPLAMRENISLRVRNFESGNLKVNDAAGNPVEIGAVIVWRVVDTAKAVFDVEDFHEFVQIQTEIAVRHIASQFPYDAYEDDEMSLRENRDEVAAGLLAELQQHLTQAGVEVLDTRLRHIAYAPEIAADMLRRQQANAVVAARRRIVEGAVGMVEDALEQLSARHVVELDEERKAAMVSNLLVVLTSESQAQPVINAGSLYQ